LERFGTRLDELAGEHPGRVRRVWALDHFEIWEVDLPLGEILDCDGLTLPAETSSAKLSGESPTHP
jgi:hypothetical protein